ncbi:MAG TPA: nitronate monooxygenase [Chthoniobacterales bacterium]
MRMRQWPDQRILNLLAIETPIIQAPMASADSLSLALAVAKAGGLGSLACALKNMDEIRTAVRKFREETVRPFNLNFFCHRMTAPGQASIERWKAFLAPFYLRWGLDIGAVPESRLRMPFDEEACALVEELAPAVASFHFGLPAPSHVDRLKDKGIRILSTATTVAEAKWLEQRGCDAIIVQGLEAGGHRGMFLDRNPATQVGLFALLPQVADEVKIPMIATGGIADARGIVAAFVLGASAVQIGTAYLFCPEAEISPLYRKAIQEVGDNGTALTNLFSGRPARGIVNRYLEEGGFISDAALPFPYAAMLTLPLRIASEKARSTEHMQMWAGQAASLGKTVGAEQLTRTLATTALDYWDRL